MESLLANYASSGDDEPQQITHPPTIKNPSLPPPKSSSLFSSLPQPKQPLKSALNDENDGDGGKIAAGTRLLWVLPPLQVQEGDPLSKPPKSPHPLLKKKARQVLTIMDTVIQIMIGVQMQTPEILWITVIMQLIKILIPENYYVNYADYSNYQSSVDTNSGSTDVATIYGSYESANYNVQYENNWADGSATTMLPEPSRMAELGVKVKGKRGRNEIPTEIFEVKQDELMKNRPREDQGKMTGIAFGPSYQPASSKGKPTKLHKRKHQIGSLYFDMKQKEMELQERRSRGLLTKADTQAKYGW
ncbi:poly(rC)-binding protein 3-like [Hibiscus syriacus]|uniref:Poly(RC)-binding protein 3-like n=1 Tax=Hibiscus syriacus TaxID=106335 RepID=A0A6A3B3D0_HIBSY|nr:poly(rC)-binding protein 3-like [Hibiscus syriacus]